MNHSLIQLNLGCGLVAPEGWVNCDSSWTARFSSWPFLNQVLSRSANVASWPRNLRYVDLRRTWPWNDSSVDVVYASHVFEHLAPAHGQNFLKEAYRVLKPHGVLRIVVPDFKYHASQYVAKDIDDVSAADGLLRVLHLSIPDSLPLFRQLYYIITGYPSIHKTMYDEAKLKDLLLRYRYINLSTSSYGLSRHITEIRSVESATAGYEGSLYLEGIKPTRGEL